MSAQPYVIDAAPPPLPGTQVRVLATNDMLGAALPLPTTYGQGGSIGGVIQMLQAECERIPALWVDCGDQTVGGRDALFGHAALNDLETLPLAAAAVGNHEFDQGCDAMRSYAAHARFPLLCADRDVGLPGSTLIETGNGAVGVVAVTHPASHLFSAAPPRAGDWRVRVVEHVQSLRREGARWVLALLHDGVTWWPSGGGSPTTGTRVDSLHTSSEGWATHFDAILAGHTLTAWTGLLHGVPSGQAHSFAASVLVVDLGAAPQTTRIHAPVRVIAADAPVSATTAAAIEAARSQVIGHVQRTWLCRPDAEHYLPDLIATATRRASGADAAFVPAGQLFTQAPLDGTVAALAAGPLTELEVQRVFPFPADEVAVVDLLPGELDRLTASHDANADPSNLAADHLWWNWARMRAGVSIASPQPHTLAIAAFATPLLASWLGRELTIYPNPTGGAQALRELGEGSI